MREFNGVLTPLSRQHVSTSQLRRPHLMALPRVHTNLGSRHFATSDVESDPSQPSSPRMRDRRWVFLIQQSSYDPDPTAILLPRSSCFHDLEYPMFGLSPCELQSSRDLSISATCLLIWTAPGLLATSPPLVSSCFATLDTKFSALLLMKS
jgi:hypothetical protein